MKSFHNFITEATRGEQGHQALDDYKMSKRTDTPLEVGRVGAKRKKTDAEKKRVKAIGGGKTAPAKDYKQRKDVGSQRPKGTATSRQQQPEKERGSARLSMRDQQKKARAERMKANAGGKGRGELQKAADKLLAKKKKSVDPKYKPQKASGYTAHERRKIRRAGQRLVKDIQQGKEKPISHYNFKL